MTWGLVMRTLWLYSVSWITQNNATCAAFLWSLYAFAQGAGLKFVELDVPGALHEGESSWLICDYDLGNDELYSVKWYKNNLEFFRYLPSDVPPAQYYDQLGVYVNLSMSNATHVYLWKTDLNTEGNYGCEVSTEGPSYRTVKADKELRIYVIPNDGPVIEGIHLPYQIGDSVNITCTSGPSRPFSHMKWYLNGVEVLPTYEMRYSPGRHPNGLQTTVIGLTFVIEFNHIRRERMEIACTSSIPQVYSSTSQEFIINDRGPSANPYKVSQRAVGNEAPSIEGNLSWYDVGDIINVNCSSARSAIPAHIRWFVNGVEPKREQLIKYRTLQYKDGTEISKLGLRMRIEHHHFKSDELRIRCTSTLYRMVTRQARSTLISSAEKRGFFRLFSSYAGTHSKCDNWLLIFTVVILKEVLWLIYILQ